jgi:hypothetical protein
VSSELTGVQPDPRISVKEPWQSWGDTLRYVVVRLSQAIPTAVLVWQACIHHLTKDQIHLNSEPMN